MTPQESTHNQCSEHRERVKFDEQIDRDIRDLKYILVGVDGKNGMRSDVKKLCADVEALERWKVQAMTIFLLIQTIGVPIAVTVILKYLK